MIFDDDALNRLAPVLHWQADWTDVLRRAGEPEALQQLRSRRSRTRRLVVALVALAAVTVPLVAFAASNDWWFLKLGGVPQPLTGPVVVKEGEWSGHHWQLAAYPSSTDGLCFAVSPKGSAQSGSAMSCAAFSGVPRTAQTKASPDMTITYMSGQGPNLPTYVVGPVIDKAVEVEIRFVNGHDLRVPTFGAPAPFEHIRFYATEIPDKAVPQGIRGLAPVFDWIAGRDKDGQVVACLAPLTAKDGISPLTDCR